MEFIKTFLGGSAGAAIVAGLFAIIQWRLNRKAQREDKAAERSATSCAARGQEIKDLQTKVDNLTVALRIDLYDKIKGKAKAYIKRGYITVEEYEDLKAMHSVYHTELGGNGFLDALMKDVDHLEKRVL